MRIKAILLFLALIFSVDMNVGTSYSVVAFGIKVMERWPTLKNLMDWFPEVELCVLSFLQFSL